MALSFVPVSAEVLPPGNPVKMLKEVDAVVLGDMGSGRQVKVRLFVETKVTDPLAQGPVHGFLDDGGGASFDLGVVGNYGFGGVTVRSRDVNGDGQHELEITGGMGSTYGERRIYRYKADRLQITLVIVRSSLRRAGHRPVPARKMCTPR